MCHLSDRIVYGCTSLLLCDGRLVAEGKQGVPEGLPRQQNLFAETKKIETEFFFYVIRFITVCICRHSDSTVSEDAGIEHGTVAKTLALAVRRSNHTVRPTVILARLDIIHFSYFSK